MYELEVIDVTELNEQMAKLEAWDPDLQPFLEDAMKKSVTYLEGQVKVAVPVGVSGRHRKSIASEVNTFTAGTTRAGSVLSQGRVGSTIKGPSIVALELGRKPGKMPPPSALVRWVHLKLGVPTEQAPGVAYTVARKIGRVGTKAVRMFQNALTAGLPIVRRLHANAVDKFIQTRQVK